METIKVNMSPNPLDVQTIHASQNDGEARQWEFELHNNGELIDTSEITEQLFFKAYKGGTEQLLPENTSTPTTSPFKGDIRYPQGLLADQEFTYRQSPTESDGLAKITDVKGNTLVWNQLAEPLESGNYVANNGTVTYNNGVATYTASSAGASRGLYQRSAYRPAIIGHKYLISALITSGNSSALKFGFIDTPNQTIPQNTKQRITKIATVSYTGALLLYFTFSEVGSFSVENLMMIDLTQMGLDSLTAEQFISLFPLPFYDFNQGSLLSLNGNGIKTVGFNQWDEEWEVGAVNSSNGANESASDRIRSKGYIRCLPNTEYFYTAGNANLRIIFYDANKAYIGYLNYSEPHLFITPSNCGYMRFNSNAAYGTTYNNDICINISSSRNGEYEPYTSSTLSLPISTYFPNGMKSAGSVYDELTEGKVITRIGTVDLGSLNWTNDIANRFYSTGIARAIKKPNNSSEYADGLTCAIYTSSTSPINEKTQMQTIAKFTNGNIYVLDDRYSNDATAFKTAMNGVYLYYELATPTETSFTTASLVTENAEIPLSNNDGVLLGKCTEQLSENPGFIDAKIKLSDSDGECYSNKIQLHVERSPQ